MKIVRKVTYLMAIGCIFDSLTSLTVIDLIRGFRQCVVRNRFHEDGNVQG